MDAKNSPQVAVMMGSTSDWPVMQHTVADLNALGIACETRVLSAHRTPDEVRDYVKSAPGRGIQVFIAGAGGAAHLAGVIASFTVLPVLGVPMESPALKGMDSLLSIVQMPAGIPVLTLAIGKAGARNAGLAAAAILALGDADLSARLEDFRAEQARKVLASELPVD